MFICFLFFIFCYFYLFAIFDTYVMLYLFICLFGPHRFLSLRMPRRRRPHRESRRATRAAATPGGRTDLARTAVGDVNPNQPAIDVDVGRLQELGRHLWNIQN